MAYAGMQRNNYAAGDYYSYRAGGLFGTIGRVIGGAVKGFVKGGPLGAIGGAASAVIPQRPTGTAVVPFAPMSGLPSLQIPRSVTQVGPGGAIYKHTEYGAKLTGPSGAFGGRRRMNVANPRALRRALRRVAGFGKLARRAKRDIARAASAIGVHQGRGRSPGVITRSEAARALRR